MINDIISDINKDTESKKRKKEVKDAKDSKEAFKSNEANATIEAPKLKNEQQHFNLVDLLKESKHYELDARCCLFLRALVEHHHTFPFMKEATHLENHSLSKEILLSLFPELASVQEKLPSNLSLLEALCVILIPYPILFKCLNYQQVVQELIEPQQSDLASTVRLLFKFTHFPRSYAGEELLTMLIPGIKSHHTEIFRTILRQGNSKMLQVFMNGSYNYERMNSNCDYQAIVVKELMENYRPGDKTIFHDLCDIRDASLADDRICMILKLTSTSIVLFQTFKTAEGKTIDPLNVPDAEGHTPLDYASLWTRPEHLDVLNELKMVDYNYTICCYRYKVKSFAQTLRVTPSASQNLFPLKPKDKFKGIVIKSIQEPSASDSKALHDTFSQKKIIMISTAALSNFLTNESVVPVTLILEEKFGKKIFSLGIDAVSYGTLAGCLKSTRTEPFIQLLKSEDDAGFLKRLEVAKKMTASLVAVHKLGIIHGDISPTTIFLHEDPTSKALICKLGILEFSPLIQHFPIPDVRIDTWSEWTKQNNAIPPELHDCDVILEGIKFGYTQLSDVYSLGKVLEMLFQKDLKDHQKTEKLKLCIESAMSRDPKNRITSEQLALNLEKILAQKDSNLLSSEPLKLKAEAPTTLKQLATILENSLPKIPYVCLPSLIKDILKHVSPLTTLTETTTKTQLNRLKMTDYDCLVWRTAARFNGSYCPTSTFLKKIPIGTKNIQTIDIDPEIIESYLLKLRTKYAPLKIRDELWFIFENIIESYLQGLFFVSKTQEQRSTEALKRQEDFRAAFVESQPHFAFNKTTHAHAHLIRILSNVTNFYLTHFQTHRHYEKGIIQLIDIGNAFELSGYLFSNGYTKYVFQERPIIFCFQRFDGKQFKQHFSTWQIDAVNTNTLVLNPTVIPVTEAEMAAIAKDEPLPTIPVEENKELKHEHKRLKS